MVTDNLRLLAEGRISPAVDVYVVYRALFHNEQPPELHRPYCVPDQFFSITYVTPAFRHYLEDFLGKISRNEPEAYALPALLGSGKSHFLALLLHVIALYRQCSGNGECVSKELGKYGLKVNTPTISRVPEVVVFHGQYSLGDLAATIRRISDKNELRAFLSSRAPIVLVFDETQYFESKDSGFIPWIQMLSEVVKEVPGAYLFVSFSLFPGERPELQPSRALDAVRRVGPIIVELDTVRNIVEVFRRWSGLTPRSVDLSSLKEIVNDNEYRDFERRLRDTYPFNPVFLDIVLSLGEESIVERTHVQLTRELLRTLAIAYVKAREGELVTFIHLPEPRNLIVIGGDFAAYWDTLVRFYEEDKRRIEEKKLGNVVISVLRHIFLSTFLARLMPSSILYPSEDDLVLGSFNGLDVRPLDVKAAIQDITEAGLHVARLGNKYIYWYIRDETDAIRDAMLKFSVEDSMQVVTDEVASLVRERSGAFSAVYVSGVGGPKSFGKVRIISSKDEWQKILEDSDDSILAIDLLDFGVSKRRNNLIMIRRDDSVETPREIKEVLGRFTSVKYVKDAVDYLGRIIKAIDEVNENLYNYFPDLLTIEGNERLRREMEELLRGRLAQWKERITILLKQVVNLWLRNVIVGFKDRRDVKRLDDFLADIARSKNDIIERIVEQIFEGNLIEWNEFKRIGDLWSLYLYNESFPSAPISFDEFKDRIRDYCTGCRCIFETSGEVVWLSKDGCRVPQLGKDVGVAPFIWHKGPVEWAVEFFLKQLARQSSGSRRYYIVYRRPSGEEVKKYVVDLLSSRNDWIYLNEGRIEEEIVSKSIDVKIDGISTYIVERNPGSKVLIEVSASDNMKSVIYRIGDAENEVMVNGTSYRLEIEVPREPGDYKLELEAMFDDGSKDIKSVVVKVKGKCIRSITTYSISANDMLRGIGVTSIDAADKLLQYLQRLVPHGYNFKFKLSANQNVSDVTINLTAEFEVSSPDKVNSALRLLRALRDISPSIYATVEFHKAVLVNDAMVEYFKGYSFQYTIERETEC